MKNNDYAAIENDVLNKLYDLELAAVERADAAYNKVVNLRAMLLSAEEELAEAGAAFHRIRKARNLVRGGENIVERVTLDEEGEQENDAADHDDFALDFEDDED